MRNFKTQNQIFILIFVSIVSVLFLIGLCSVINESLQMDFSAYYTAGRDFLLGNDIYKNNILSPLSNWDGVSRYEHSRYIYFPVFSLFFVPFSLFPYQIAKLIWTVFCFFSLIASLLLVLKHLPATESRKKMAFTFSLFLTMLFYPLKTVLERGQIEPFLLLIMTVSLILIYEKETSFAGGALLSVVALVKFQLLIFFPIFMLCGRKKAVIGMFFGFILINLLSFAVFGVESTSKYYFKELPRIVQYGESGTEAMLLDDAEFQKRLQELDRGISLKDGRSYKASNILFYSNASLTKAISKRLSVSSVYVLLFFCTIFFFVVAYLQFKKQQLSKLITNRNRYWEFWLAVLLFSVSVSPVSWTTALVWLLPLFLVLICSEKICLTSSDHLMFFAGYVFIAFPDNLLFAIKYPVISNIVEGKYLYGQILILATLFVRFVSWKEESYENS